MAEVNNSDPSFESAPWSARLPRMNPVRAFGTVFFSVFLLIFLSSAAVTLIMPESYSAAARVVAPGTAQLESLQSSDLLRAVSKRLNLPETLAARYGESKAWDDQRVEDFLRRVIRVRPLPPTEMFEIRATTRSGSVSAQLANAVAEQARQTSSSVMLVEQAVPPLRPSRPNKPLNLWLGALVGIFLGTLAGGVGAKLAVGFEGPGTRTV